MLENFKAGMVRMFRYIKNWVIGILFAETKYVTLLQN